MHIGVRPQTAAVIALAAAAALALAGCSSSDGSGTSASNPEAAASRSAKPSPKGTGEPIGRHAVDDQVKAALRLAGLDPDQGKGSGDTSKTKNESVVDWTAVTTTQRAEAALPRLDEQLKRLGWRETAPQSYEKTDWVLLIGSTKQSSTVNLKPGESQITVNGTYLGAG
ncbi:hypothetical protein ADK52_13695 [Streptomyces sp. WM6372]|uniref:hypothetical protein n=1 Tax=Streptomyces sp. WM6372 TaxID=1415555 RepID=UPI0006ADC01B|nr:hypothetical protein [Streptomyces sp. WM6372]KOU24667.1 hypothetical protein ADK52_13695 [Streptomyces sp. WM6372]